MSEPTPERLWQRRISGYRMESPNGLPTKGVARPGPWGNPYETAAEFRKAFLRVKADLKKDKHPYYFSDALRSILWMVQNIRRLRGTNLGCFCKIGDDCHAAVLIEFANAPEPERKS